jgi:hypothetical protein
MKIQHEDVLIVDSHGHGLAILLKENPLLLQDQLLEEENLSGMEDRSFHSHIKDVSSIR